MRRWLLALLVLAVLAGGADGAWQLTRTDPGPPAGPAAIAPSPLPSRTPLLAPLPEGSTSAVGLQRSLAAVLAQPALGRRVSLTVVGRDGTVLLDRLGSRSVTPASTAKIVTAVAALTVLPADRRLRTEVVRGARPGEVVLVGGGDATLGGRLATPGYPGAANLRTLARGLTGVTRVLVDDSRYVGPRLAPGWKAAYVSDGDVAPVSALSVDEGRTAKTGPRTTDPALAAGRQLAALLHVTSPVARAHAPLGAAVLAAVESAPVPQLVEAMLTRSDNDLAESLGRQVALAVGQPASFAGASAATTAVLQRLGVRGIALQDSSGLSRRDLVQPAAIASLLSKAAGNPTYTALLSGLPVAGFDGTLAQRYRKAPTSTAAGLVRAKTGTLDGVSALAGLVTTRSGGVLAFDITADGIAIGSTAAAEAALDRVAAALAACGCD